MPYKDKGKQRETDRLRQQRRRDRIKAKGVTLSASTCEASDVTAASHPTAPITTDVFTLSPDQAKAIINNWAQGKGTQYQQALIGRIGPALQIATNAPDVPCDDLSQAKGR